MERPEIFCSTCPFGQCSRTRLPRSPPRSIPYCWNFTRAAKTDAENPELLAWSGTTDEKPINRWDGILLSLERLAPDKPLVPENAAERFNYLESVRDLRRAWFRLLEPARNRAIRIRFEISNAKLANPRAELAATLKQKNDFVTAAVGPRLVTSLTKNFARPAHVREHAEVTAAVPILLEHRAIMHTYFKMPS